MNFTQSKEDCIQQIDQTLINTNHETGENFKIDKSLYYNQSGEAEYIKTEATADEPLPFNKISVDQVFDLVCKRKLAQQGHYNSDNEIIPNFIIIDCRFDYEFAGGHIDGAVNLSSPDELSDFLLSSKERLESLMASRTMLIFHCEFSEKRAPFMYSCLREQDRRCNVEMYPCLWFPEIYVMQGGFCAFWQKYQNTPIINKAISVQGEKAGAEGENASHIGYIRQTDANDRQHVKQYAVLNTNKKQRMQIPKLL